MSIQRDVSAIKKRILGEEPPEHFGEKDIIRAFFGALLFGFSFAFNSLLVQVSQHLTKLHLFFIVLTTLIILTAEIYFIGYSRVENKKARRFGQFWLKRIISFYMVAIVTTFALIYLYGLVANLNSFEELQLVIAISLPCAVGASLADLLRQY